MPSTPPFPLTEPAELHGALLAWYAENSRDLPWLRPEATPWSVMVSEFMLQQTPVSRVLPVHQKWLERWPSPGALAAEPAGEAVRAWGRLGYPRRALRLHAAAATIMVVHDGEVPASYDALLALPGVGEYTAAAIATFAFGQRHVVLDTNVRRVLARAVGGVGLPPPSVTRAERGRAEATLPDDPEEAAAWAVATMELGALVCTAARPTCSACPIRAQCRWLASGRPAYDGPPRRTQPWAGTDRQCRGRLLQIVREAPGPVSERQLAGAWEPEGQGHRCLASLVADGLVVEEDGRYRLP